MAVDLSLLPEKLTIPNPPRWLLWGGLLLATLLSGFILTLFVFPPEGSDKEKWFWGQALAIPFLCWLVPFSCRFYYLWAKAVYAESWNKNHDVRRAELIEFAQRPLALVSQSIVTGTGRRSHAAAITSDSLKIVTEKPANGDVPIPHMPLVKDDALSVKERLRYAFNRLKDELKLPKQEALAADGLQIKLSIACGLEHDDIVTVWRDCWENRFPPQAEVELFDPEQGVVLLDEWLDDYRNDRGYLLVVSVQLYEQAVNSNAEAATAMLFAGIDTPSLDKGTAIYIHRPVQGDAALALADAVLWGNNGAEKIDGIWCSEGKTKYVAQALARFHSLAGTTPNVYRIDAALGNAETTAGWLALAIAAEQAMISSDCQLASYSREQSVFMVVNTTLGDTA